MTKILSKDNAALLVIDMQNGFCHEDSQMGRNVGVEPQLAIIDSIGELVAYCRDRGVPVFWSQQIHFPGDITRARKKLRTHAQKQKFLPCLKGTFETEFHPRIQLLIKPEDQIITKHRASVFFDTNLDTRLRMLGVSNLIIAGCNTEFCVAHTIRDAYARDYELIVVRDCVAGIKPEYHELYLKLFSDYFAEVIAGEHLPSYFLL